jgi:hypothetical protein
MHVRLAKQGKDVVCKVDNLVFPNTLLSHECRGDDVSRNCELLVWLASVVELMDSISQLMIR